MVHAKISLPILFVFHLFTHSFFFKFSIFFPSTLAYFLLSVLLLSSTYLSFLSPCFLLLFLLFILPLFFSMVALFLLCLPSASIPYLLFLSSISLSFLSSSLSFFPSIHPSSFSSMLPLFLLSAPFSSSSAFRFLHTHLQFIVLHDLPQKHRVILFTFDHRSCPIITNLTYI